MEDEIISNKEIAELEKLIDTLDDLVSEQSNNQQIGFDGSFQGENLIG